MNARSCAFDVRLVWATIAFAIGLGCYLGLVLHDDVTGRYLFGTTWSAVGVWWLGRYLEAKKPPEDNDWKQTGPRRSGDVSQPG